jgi:hypothetical protein
MADDFELAVTDAVEEGSPLGGSEPEHPAVWVLAVADADAAVRQSRCLDAVAVREAE